MACMVIELVDGRLRATGTPVLVLPSRSIRYSAVNTCGHVNIHVAISRLLFMSDNL